MAQGNYDHPSYLARQQIEFAATAGANGSSGYTSFISDMRFRKAAVTVRTAGTSSGAGNEALLMCIGTYVSGFSTGLIGTALTTTTGTNTIGVIATLGSSTANSVTTSTDFNVRIVAGSTVFIKNGTDATGVSAARFECYLDPEATWTGPNN